MNDFFHRNCPVCDGSAFIPWLQPPDSPGPVVRCTHCGMVLVSPVSSQKALIQEGPVLGSYPVEYLSSTDTSLIQNGWEKSVIDQYLREEESRAENARKVLNQLSPWTKPPGKLLDIGCFAGLFLREAARVGWECVGIEPLVMPSIHARGYYGLNVITDTLRRDTFPAESYDVVTLFQVAEHLVFPQQEVDLARHFLKPGGIIVIEVPNIDTLMVKILRSQHRHFVQDHVNFFSAETLSRLLSRQGFVIRSKFHPVRQVSLQHLTWWVGQKFKPARNLYRSIPDKLGKIRLNFLMNDIITIIAEKENH